MVSVEKFTHKEEKWYFSNDESTEGVEVIENDDGYYIAEQKLRED